MAAWPNSIGERMPGRYVYNLLYRIGAARWGRGWDRGVGPELRALVNSGRVSPSTLPPGRAIDLGCGAGANVLFLAQHGFDAIGVDFSRVAVEQARSAARRLDLVDRANFAYGDVTADHIPGAEGPFDLVVAYNTLQDLRKEARPAMTTTIRRLTRPGAAVVLWCYYQDRNTLPLLSYRGPSRLAPFVVTPGEEVELFGRDFDLERLHSPSPETGTACFLLTRRP
jgi:SAM-dependent methyltransferase